MKNIMKATVFLICVIAYTIFPGTIALGQSNDERVAHAFILNDLQDRPHDLSSMRDRPMMILYFFDAESRPSQEGLLSLHHIMQQYGKADLAVWAITLSDRESIANFVKNTEIAFPVLIDTSGASRLYNAEVILPTVYILGPHLNVLDTFQGGGKTTEAMLVRIAERELQRKQTGIAKTISDEVVKKDPGNVKAGAVKGFASLQEGNVAEAEKSFTGLSKKGKEGSVLGKEGLAAVYVKKNQPEKALELAREVQRDAPERSYPHFLEGDIRYAQNKTKEAEEAYKKAAEAKEAAPYQEALPYNQLGRLEARAGQYTKARELYDKAIAIDPFYITGTTNKGLTYEKEGNYDKALESYRQALSLNQNDTFASVLARKAEEYVNLQKDVESRKRIDKLVKDLAARFREQKEVTEKTEDDWTSRPMVLSFVDFQEKGGLSERDGLSIVMATQLTHLLNSSGRLQVVERVLIERLLEELNLGTSELADPETALKLGKVLAAKIIVTGTIFNLPQSTMLSLRLIDTETSAIPKVTTWQMDHSASLDKELFKLNREILKTVISKYPLRGFIVTGEGDQYIINLGSNQGVVTGTKFEVIEEQAPIKYKGKVLHSLPKSVALCEVVNVEPDLSHVRVIRSERAPKADDRIQEKMEERAL